MRRIFSGEVTELAGAVPLGNTASGGSPQHFELKHSLQFCGCVAVDLATEVYFLEIRTGPGLRFHGDLLCILELSRARAVFPFAH